MYYHPALNIIWKNKKEEKTYTTENRKKSTFTVNLVKNLCSTGFRMGLCIPHRQKIIFNTSHADKLYHNKVW